MLKDGEWQPGAQIVVTGDGSYEAGVLVNCTDDKVLLKGFAGKIKVFKRSACKVVPLKQNLKVGDEVYAIFTSSYKAGYKIKNNPQVVTKSYPHFWEDLRAAGFEVKE